MKHKIVILVGKSGSGKSTIMQKLVEDGYCPLITNTTRPPRDNELDGVDYNFLTKEQFNNLIENGQMVEYRKYNTVFGTWYYGSSAENVDLNKHDYVIVLTLDGAEAWVNYFGAENCIVFYIDCPKSIREERAEERGSFNREEWNRRIVTDKQDFTIEKIAKICNFKIANYNKKLYNVIKEIESDIKIWKS
jgi:guanylate kinase